MSSVGHGGSRCNRAATASMATFPSAIPFGVDWAAEVHDRLKPLPGHLLGPSPHRLAIEPLRSLPWPLQDTPPSFDWMICAVIRWRRQPRPRSLADISQRHSAIHTWCASAPTLRTMVHGALHALRLRLRWRVPRVSLGFDRLDDAGTHCLRTPKGDGQGRPLFIHHPTRDRLLLAPHIVSTRSVVASRPPPA